MSHDCEDQQGSVFLLIGDQFFFDGRNMVVRDPLEESCGVVEAGRRAGLPFVKTCDEHSQSRRYLRADRDPINAGSALYVSGDS